MVCQSGKPPRHSGKVAAGSDGAPTPLTIVRHFDRELTNLMAARRGCARAGSTVQRVSLAPAPKLLPCIEKFWSWSRSPAPGKVRCPQADALAKKAPRARTSRTCWPSCASRRTRAAACGLALSSGPAARVGRAGPSRGRSGRVLVTSRKTKGPSLAAKSFEKHGHAYEPK